LEIIKRGGIIITYILKIEMDKLVTQYLNTVKQWNTEMHLLREILLSCGLEESLKWGKPCYSINGENVVIVQPFKGQCDLGFFKGALLKDPKHLLLKAGTHTQVLRQMRFTSIEAIEKSKITIKQFVKEAKNIQASGEKIKVDNKIEIIDELQQAFKKNPALKKAFTSLTPGRQRAYLIFFSAAKQTATRVSRIENNVQKILCGKGMNDCTCGLSKRMPICDGSHKFLKK
jgi:uncharacterized protein YdeI (YjbR/CyaY-like superfamily)